MLHIFIFSKIPYQEIITSNAVQHLPYCTAGEVASLPAYKQVVKTEPGLPAAWLCDCFVSLRPLYATKKTPRFTYRDKRIKQ